MNDQPVLTEPQKIGLEVPPEPGLGAVVLDRSDRAWQRSAKGWTSTSAVVPSLLGMMNGSIAWTRLLVDYGPVRVIWDGEKLIEAATEARPHDEPRPEPCPYQVGDHLVSNLSGYSYRVLAVDPDEELLRFVAAGDAEDESGWESFANVASTFRHVPVVRAETSR